MNDETTCAEFIKWRRKLRGFTQADLADHVGCSVVTIRKIEAGERRPSEEMAERLATALHIPPADRSTFIQAALGRISSRSLFNTTSANLPAQLTPLIGRSQELKAIRSFLERPDVRLLSLIGPPGIGKTRLAVQSAADQLDAYEDGVFFVSLAAVRSKELVASSIGQTLGLAAGDERAMESAILKELRDKQMLLVLDNFEQVLQARSLIAMLLNDCHWLTLIVTSQEPLRIRGEHLFRIPPLDMPDLAQLPPVEELARYGAIRLFLDRAQAIQPDYTLTDNNAAAVAAICAHLDGLPLAIELVAAHSGSLTPTLLLERLTSRLTLSLHGPADAPERHQTLQAAIDWAYELLNPAEQSFFRKCAVFVESWTVAAAESIHQAATTPDSQTASAPLAAIQLLDVLVNKSLLVQMEMADGETRFKLLEPIHTYAWDLLHHHQELELVRQLHTRYYASLGDRLKVLNSNDHRAYLERLARDHGNLNAALQWSLAHGDAAMALRLAEMQWSLQQHLRAALARSQAANQVLEGLVAERTASLQEVLQSVEERERRLIQINQELALARDAAEEAHTMKARFLSTISHEFHTVLNVMINFTEFLGDTIYGTLTDQQRFFQERLVANAEYLLAVIQDNEELFESRVDERVVNPIDLAVLWPEIIAQTERFDKAKQIQFNIISSPGLPVIHGDRQHLRQMFINLLWCMGRLTHQQQVFMQIDADVAGWVCCVIGSEPISARLKAAIIAADPPAWGSDHLPLPASDIALRLSISQSLAHLHGARLWLHTDPEQGPYILVMLPINNSDHPPK